jgi:hypothetical protein
VFDEVHGVVAAAVPLPVKVVVFVWQTLVEEGVIVGFKFTVTVAEAVQPLLSI